VTTPITAEILCRAHVDLSDEQRQQLRRLLCAMHGYPDGLPLDSVAPPELVEAQYRVSRARVDLDIALQVSADGSLRVVGLAATTPDALRDELRVSEEYRTSQHGDPLPAFAPLPPERT
jgi:hypothetical protein